MNTKKMKLVRFLAVLLFAVSAQASDFAVEVVDSEGFSGSGFYDDASSVLGKPTRWIYDTWPGQHYGEIYACSLVYPAWSVDPNGGKLVSSIKNGTYIIVKFDHKVADDPGNPYGVDFIVFGNAKFEGVGDVSSNTNMGQYHLKTPASVPSEPVRVSVAQEPNGPWYSYENGPYGDSVFPTNAFEWDGDANSWGDELDWLKPVDPNLSVSDFDGLFAAEAIELYDGSAGGTGFDLKELDSNAYAALALDPNTGRKWIQYIKVEYLSGGDYEGDIDGFSDVAGCGDYQHPYPQGDINGDCRVNMMDMAVLAGNWLDCSWNCQ
jgi:hypothetical protein